MLKNVMCNNRSRVKVGKNGNSSFFTLSNSPFNLVAVVAKNRPSTPHHHLALWVPDTRRPQTYNNMYVMYVSSWYVDMWYVHTWKDVMYWKKKHSTFNICARTRKKIFKKWLPESGWEKRSGADLLTNDILNGCSLIASNKHIVKGHHNKSSVGSLHIGINYRRKKIYLLLLLPGRWIEK